jgi:hypothetical protein
VIGTRCVSSGGQSDFLNDSDAAVGELSPKNNAFPLNLVILFHSVGFPKCGNDVGRDEGFLIRRQSTQPLATEGDPELQQSACKIRKSRSPEMKDSKDMLLKCNPKSEKQVMACQSQDD